LNLGSFTATPSSLPSNMTDWQYQTKLSTGGWG
jgi:hypothetical protein